MSFSSFGWGATSSQKSWFDYSPRHQNSLTNFLLKKREGWGNYFMKNIVPFITSIYYPIWLWPKNLVLGGFPETSQLVDYLVRIAFKSKKNVLFLSIFAILSSPTLYLFFRPFWEILSRKLDDDDVMLSWKLVRKSEIRFPMPFLRLYIDQIFSACLVPLSAFKMTLLFSFIHFRTSSIKKEKWNATERIIWRILQFLLRFVHRKRTVMKPWNMNAEFQKNWPPPLLQYLIYGIYSDTCFCNAFSM